MNNKHKFKFGNKVIYKYGAYINKGLSATIIYVHKYGGYISEPTYKILFDDQEMNKILNCNIEEKYLSFSYVEDGEINYAV